MVPEESIKKINRGDNTNVDNFEYTKSEIEEKPNSRVGQELRITLIVVAVIAAAIIIFSFL